MHQQSLGISTTDQRPPPARGLSAPALLAMLCVLAALPPAAYALAPETPLLACGLRDWAEPRRDESREPKQYRTLSRACTLAVRAMMQGSGPMLVGLNNDSHPGLLFLVQSQGLVELIVGPPAHARLVEQLLDLPPPMVG